MARRTHLSAADLAGALGTVGACGWTGRRQPLAGALVPPVPPVLRRLARTGGAWLAGVFPADLGRVRRAAARAGGARFGRFVDYRLMVEPAGIVWVRHWFGVRPRGALRGVVRIIDAEKRLEAECIRACERERLTIGQELHDDLCQLLAGLAAMLQASVRTLAPGDAAARRTLAELLALLRAGMGRARRLAHGLVVLRVEKLGCAAALGELAAESGRRFGIRAVLHAGRALPVHSADQVVQLYRIAQEAIGNAVAHGGASRIALRFRSRGRRVRLTVSDNGSGLPPPGQRSEGLGLLMMGYRAATFGGVVSVAPAGRRGTAVTVDYECRAPARAARRTLS